MLRTIDRPTNATLRSFLTAASAPAGSGARGSRSSTLRCVAASAEDGVDGRADVLFRGRESGHLGVGRVGEEQVDALFGEAGEGTEVGDALVERELVHLEVAVCSTRRLGADRDGESSGMEWFTAMNSRSNGPNERFSPATTSTTGGDRRSSWNFAPTNARVSLDPPRDVLAFLDRYGNAADVVSWPW